VEGAGVMSTTAGEERRVGWKLGRKSGGGINGGGRDPWHFTSEECLFQSGQDRPGVLDLNDEGNGENSRVSHEIASALDVRHQNLTDNSFGKRSKDEGIVKPSRDCCGGGDDTLW